MDYFFLHALVHQLQPQLQGALLNKVFQPQRDVLIFRLWNGRCEHRLLLGTGGVGPRIYLTTAAYRNPMRPPRFCQLLRARLQRLVSIQIDKADRVVTLDFLGQQDETYRLIAELFGREGNLVLLDEMGNVVDSLHRSRAGDDRPLVVGQVYIPPTPRGHIPLENAVQQLPVGGDLGEWLTTQMTPMSRCVAAELINQAQQQPLQSVLNNFVFCWHENQLHPVSCGSVLTMTTDKSCVPVDLSNFAQNHYAALTAQGADNNTDLNKVVRKALKRLNKRLQHIDQQIDQCLHADNDKDKGDLLLAHLHLMKRGMKQIEVQDYYQDPPMMVTIPLDAAKTPQENAEACFKRYRKGKRGLDHCERRQEQTRYEIEWLEQIAQQLDDSATAADSDIIRQELIDAGWYKPTSALQRETRRQSAASLVNRTQSPGGWEIVWGRNNKTNDYVSKTLLKSRDLWFHAHKIPGCHLVIKCDGATVAQEDQIFAAAIAAAHSRAGNDTSVEVMVSEGKWVKRIKGAPPGLVKVENYRVIQVTPAKKTA
ncbi:MAG: NFACT RNA binding domain-containing protein [Thermodesulfobacteriota bacterium]|nr:NFACT RNA binding domain-containing protein [Thermodesulfobacteriota bacterium]